MENSLFLKKDLRNFSNVCAADDILSRLSWKYIPGNRSLLDLEYQWAANTLFIYQKTTFISDIFQIRSYTTALDDIFVSHVLFNFGLFTFLRNIIGPISDHWHFWGLTQLTRQPLLYFEKTNLKRPVLWKRVYLLNCERQPIQTILFWTLYTTQHLYWYKAKFLAYT